MDYNKKILQWLEFWFMFSKTGNTKLRDYWHTVLINELYQ